MLWPPLQSSPVLPSPPLWEAAFECFTSPWLTKFKIQNKSKQNNQNNFRTSNNDNKTPSCSSWKLSFER